MDRTILTYPYISGAVAVPGRCYHQVRRFGGVEPCQRPATQTLAGVGLCRVHYGHFLFWQRGGVAGTAAEMFDHLVAGGAAVTPYVDARTRRPSGDAVRAPEGRALYVRRGSRVGYGGLARHRGLDGEWHYRLEYPFEARLRRAFRRVAADAVLLLDVTTEAAVADGEVTDGE
jgi:hypothetical protein